MGLIKAKDFEITQSFEVQDIRHNLELKELYGEDSLFDEQNVPVFEDAMDTKELIETKDNIEVKKELEVDDEWIPPNNENEVGSSEDEDKPLVRKRSRKLHVVSAKPKKPKKDKRVRRRKPKPIEEKKENLFHFPQDEALRDKSLPFQCHLCVKGFEKRVPYQQHLYRHKAKSREDAWFCILCNGLPFKKWEDLQKHKKDHANDPDLTCSLCDFKCPSNMPQRFKKHMSRHNRNTVCKSCGKDYANSKLKNKLKDHQIALGKFHDAKCRLCPDLEEFQTWEEHQKHLRDEHNGQFQYKCGYCPAFFFADSQMNIHRRECKDNNELTNKHRQKDTHGAKKVVCHLCGQVIRYATRRYHYEDAHGDQEVECTICKRTYKHPNSLKRHMLCHRRFTCDICGQSGALSRYRTHMLTNHTEGHLRPYNCDVCGKGFIREDRMVKHADTHKKKAAHVAGGLM